MQKIKTFFLTCFFALLPLAVWAQGGGDEDAPVPLTPEVKAEQLTVFGVVALLVILFIVWYFYRRWQIQHSGNVVHGTDPRQD
ncbi:MAG TPA: hypothetical protein VKT32_14255 [Chthonomonadaceae bacterium]|nr:hypothetical protein [Chthonomonadaceae bacterium]